MSRLYEVIFNVFRFFYALTNALFLYNPNAGTISLPDLVRQMITNPCSIQNGLFGILFSPELVPIIGLFLILFGVGWILLSVSSMFQRTFGMILNRVIVLTGQLASLIGRTPKLGQRGMGGGYSRYGYEADEAMEGGLHSFRDASLGIALILVGGLLSVSGTNETTRSILQAIGNLFSGVIVIVSSLVVELMNSLVAAALGATYRSICP
ncbi:MAG: hypothetical protein QW734_05080 [Candidatus Bathyarchaeia archaeon]